ncbi:MAG: hypothetical protein CMH83_20000 [Nocardioides sp.]|nr:hypothetical protein [Nocardioides sp.]
MTDTSELLIDAEHAHRNVRTAVAALMFSAEGLEVLDTTQEAERRARARGELSLAYLWEALGDLMRAEFQRLEEMCDG